MAGLQIATSSCTSVNFKAVRDRISRRQFTVPAPSCRDVTADVLFFFVGTTDLTLHWLIAALYGSFRVVHVLINLKINGF